MSLREELDFVRRLNALADQRDAAEKARWPLRRVRKPSSRRRAAA